jgi:hypothetical protein
MDIEALLDWNDAARVAADRLRAHPLAKEQFGEGRFAFAMQTKESRAMLGAARILER